MPLFHWTQVAGLCLVAALLGYLFARVRFGSRLPTPKEPVSEPVPRRSHETPALRVLEEQFRSGRLGFDESLELAAAYRKQGDTQAAIEIHQSLYGRPGLKWQDLQRAQFELARDFFHAGILGRSEDLLRSLVSQRGPLQVEAVRLLLTIYQQEQDWEEAAGLFADHPELIEGDLKQQYLHVLCAQAEQVLPQNPGRAEQLAEQARAQVSTALRPLIILLEIALMKQHWRDFQRGLAQYLGGSPERVDLLKPVLTTLIDRNPRRFGQIQKLLQQYHNQVPVRRLEGELLWYSGRTEDAVQRFKSVPLTAGTLHWRLSYLANLLPDNRELQELVQDVGQQRARISAYVCNNCGFEAKQHHWKCPQCSQWDTLTPADVSQGRLIL